MSEEIKNDFMDSVKSVSTLWCSKAISTEDLLAIFKNIVDVTEKRMSQDSSSWGNMI